MRLNLVAWLVLVGCSAPIGLADSGSAGGASSAGGGESAAGGTPLLGGGSGGGLTGGGNVGGGTADMIPPRILSSVPSEGASQVPLSSPDGGFSLSLEFSEPIDAATFMLSFSPPLLAGPPQFSNGNASVAVNTQMPLAPNTAYTVMVSARDLANNVLSPTMIRFTSAGPIDRTAPTVVTTLPMNAATNIAPASPVSVTFSEPIAVSSVVATMVGSLGFGVPTMTMNDTLATWSMPLLDDGGVGRFESASTYRVRIEASDLAGNAMAAAYEFSFTTTAPPDAVPPQLIGFLPADMSTQVPTNSAVVLTFSEPMATTSVERSVRFNGMPRPGQFEWNASHTVVRFLPMMNWNPNALYLVSFAQPVGTDVAGNPLGAVSRSFTTGAVVDSSAATLTTQTPAAGSAAVPPLVGCLLPPRRPATSVSLTFSSAVDPVSTSAAFSVLDGAMMPIAGTTSFQNNGTVLIFTPARPFAYQTTFTVRLNTASAVALDLQRNPIANVTSTFTTLREVAVTLLADRTQSGRILSGPVLGQQTTAPGIPLRVGDFDAIVRSRAFLSFDLSPIPPHACVTVAALALQQTAVTGTPYGPMNLGNLLVEVVNTGPLDDTDYMLPPIVWPEGNTVTFSTTPMIGNVFAAVGNQVRLALRNPMARWRLRFSNDALPNVGSVENVVLSNQPALCRLVLRYEAP